MAITEIAIEAEVSEAPAPPRRRRRGRLGVIAAGVALAAAGVTGVVVAADDSEPSTAVRDTTVATQAFDPLLNRYGPEARAAAEAEEDKPFDPLLNRFGPGR